MDHASSTGVVGTIAGLSALIIALLTLGSGQYNRWRDRKDSVAKERREQAEAAAKESREEAAAKPSEAFKELSKSMAQISARNVTLEAQVKRHEQDVLILRDQLHLSWETQDRQTAEMSRLRRLMTEAGIDWTPPKTK